MLNFKFHRLFIKTGKAHFGIAVLSFLLQAVSAVAQVAGPGQCSRTAVLGTTSLNDPMGLTTQDVYRSSVFSRIAELVTSSAFRLSGEDAGNYAKSLNENKQLPGFGSERRIPEYSFESELISGLNETGPDGRYVRSRWTISLWFEGESRELVYSWQALGTQETRPSNPADRNRGTTFSGLGNKMAEQFREGPSINEIIEKFEKRPVSCSVNNESKEAGPEETIEIILSGFADKYGQRSREFNRIVVHAVEGEITNGEDCDAGPGYKVFMLKEGAVKLKYRAPSGCDIKKDNILVYNSCEIVPEGRLPLNKTTIGDKIAEKEIAIVCYDAVLVLSARKLRTRNTSDNGSSQSDPGKNCRTEWSSLNDLTENTEAVVRIPLKSTVLNNATFRNNPMVNQVMMGFTPVKAVLESFSYSFNDHSVSKRETSGRDCPNSGSLTEKTISRSLAETPVVNFMPLENSISLVFDSKTNKALKIGFPGAGVRFRYTETTENRSETWPSDKPPQTRTTTTSGGSTIDVEPVGDPVPDPSPMEINYNPVMDSIAKIKEKYKDFMPAELLSSLSDFEAANKTAKSTSKIQPDILVTKGDGKTIFGGEGRKTTEKKISNGTEKTELTFSWQLTVKKNQIK